MTTDAASALDEIRSGLSADPKQLPSKYFYDDRGAALFDEITRLPEYYLTRLERVLLHSAAAEWVREHRFAGVVELGPGSAEKTHLLLNAAVDRDVPLVYVPVDVSDAYLRGIATRIGEEYPQVRVQPILADITDDIGPLSTVPQPKLVAFLGSTIGNFEEEEAIALLRRVRAALAAGDRLLLGTDLAAGPRKPAAVIESAYNDAAGVTAEFNRNLLRAVNGATGTNFDPQAFAHHAFYDAARQRIEMHLVPDREQRVRLPDGGEIRIQEGESLRTEISGKYDRPKVDRMFRAAGLQVDAHAMDDDEWYALWLAEPA